MQPARAMEHTRHVVMDDSSRDGMAFLTIAGERYALSIGDTTLGGDADEVLRASPLATLAPFAVLTSGDEVMSIRAIGAAPAVAVNGQALDSTPRALRHGDRITAESLVVHVGDLRAAGRTARASGVSDAEIAASAALPGASPTAATGGCLTLIDEGSVHPIPATGLVIGREPDCDIALCSREVSRRHATIVPGLLGYTLIDESTNGVLVNGTRVERSHLLSQGDVVRIGDTICRFTADSATYEPEASVWAAETVPLAEPVAPSASEHSPPTVPTARRVRDTPPRPTEVLLATLDVLAGSIPIGMRFRLERPVAQLGRGVESDVCLLDDSVSGAHATLMLRESTWHLIDHASRNGTYVDGQRVSQCALHGPCELRLGGVTLYFQPVRTTPRSSIGTLGLIGLTDEQIGKRPQR
jgi:pSer/pThr/pTyr-binding forkhead associated (FHA) protein